MRRRVSGLIVLAVLAALAGGERALAQGYPSPGPYGPPPGAYDPYNAPPVASPPGGVDEAAAIRMLAARGFTNIGVVRRRGPTLVMEANGPRGERVQLIVDGASGAINGMKVIGFGDKRY